LKRHVPLLAYSETLDRHGYAVMDCPDIDSSDDPHSKFKTAQVRRGLINKAVSLCSGFVIMSEHDIWQNVDYLHLVKFISEITDASAQRIICLTKTLSQECNKFDSVQRTLRANGLPPETFEYIHSPYSENGVRYFGADGLEWVASPESLRPTQSNVRDILKTEISKKARDLVKKTCEMIAVELKTDEEKFKRRTDGVSAYLISNLFGPEGELGYIPALAGYEGFLKEVSKRKKIPDLQDFSKLMEDPSSVKSTLGQMLKKPNKRSHRYFCKIRLKDFESWAREIAEEEGFNIQDSVIPTKVWQEMALRVHETPELNGSTTEISNCILWWIYTGGIGNRLLRKDVSKMRLAADFLTRTLLVPSKCKDICLVARSEIARVLALKKIDITSDTPLGMAIDQLALTQVTAIQNWLHDFMGLPRKSLSISMNGENIYTLKALSLRKLAPLFDQNESLLPDLFEADMTEIESTDRFVHSEQG
jgi:hypothetical protein